VPPPLRHEQRRHEDGVRRRARPDQLADWLVAVHVHVGGQHHQQQRNERQQQAARQRVPHALPDDEAEVEQPVPEDRVRERGGNRQHEERGKRDEGRVEQRQPSGDHPVGGHSAHAGDTRHHRSGHEHANPPPVRRLRHGPVALNNGHSRRRQVGERRQQQHAEAVRGRLTRRQVHRRELVPRMGRRRPEHGRPHQEPDPRGSHAPVRIGEEEREQDDREHERAQVRKPQRLAHARRQVSPHLRDSIGQDHAEDAEHGEDPGPEKRGEIARPAPDDEERERERHRLDGAAQKNAKPLAGQPVTPGFPPLLEDNRPHGTLPEDLQPGGLVEAEVRGHHRPVHPRPHRPAARPDDLVTLAQPRAARRAVRLHVRHAKPGGGTFELHPFALGPHQVAVNEQDEVGEKRRNAREEPEGRPWGRVHGGIIGELRMQNGELRMENENREWRMRRNDRPARSPFPVLHSQFSILEYAPPGTGASFSASCRACHSMPRT